MFESRPSYKLPSWRSIGRVIHQCECCLLDGCSTWVSRLLASVSGKIPRCTFLKSKRVITGTFNKLQIPALTAGSRWPCLPWRWLDITLNCLLSQSVIAVWPAAMAVWTNSPSCSRVSCEWHSLDVSDKQNTTRWEITKGDDSYQHCRREECPTIFHENSTKKETAQTPFTTEFDPIRTILGSVF